LNLEGKLDSYRKIYADIATAAFKNVFIRNKVVDHNLTLNLPEDAFQVVSNIGMKMHEKINLHKEFKKTHEPHI